MSEATQEQERIAINWDAVRMLAIAVGVREAARQFGISEEATMKRCQREGWLKNEQVRAVAERSVKERMSLSANVRTPAAAMAVEMAGIAVATRLGIARGIAKAAQDIEVMSGASVIDNAHEIKSVTQTASILHNWDKSGPAPKLRVELLSENGAGLTIDVDSEVVTGQEWDEADPI